METQNSEVRVNFSETMAEKKPTSRFSRPEKLNYSVPGWPSANRGFGCDEVPTVTRARLKRRNHGTAHRSRAFLGVVAAVEFQLAVLDTVSVEGNVHLGAGVAELHGFILALVLHGARHEEGQA